MRKAHPHFEHSGGGSDAWLHDTGRLYPIFLRSDAGKAFENLSSTSLGLVRVHRGRRPGPNIRLASRVVLDSFRDGTVSSLWRG